MKYIYIDSLFFLSLFTDYLLCLITARICRLCLRRRRYLAAALLGAAYSVSVFLPDLSFMASRWMELVSAALIGESFRLIFECAFTPRRGLRRGAAHVPVHGSVPRRVRDLRRGDMGAEPADRGTAGN